MVNAQTLLTSFNRRMPAADKRMLTSEEADELRQQTEAEAEKRLTDALSILSPSDLTVTFGNSSRVSFSMPMGENESADLVAIDKSIAPFLSRAVDRKPAIDIDRAESKGIDKVRIIFPQEPRILIETAKDYDFKMLNKGVIDELTTMAREIIDDWADQAKSGASGNLSVPLINKMDVTATSAVPITKENTGGRSFLVTKKEGVTIKEEVIPRTRKKHTWVDKHIVVHNEYADDIPLPAKSALREALKDVVGLVSDKFRGGFPRVSQRHGALNLEFATAQDATSWMSSHGDAIKDAVEECLVREIREMAMDSRIKALVAEDRFPG